MTILRTEKVSERIREVLGKLFVSETHLKASVLATITRVHVTTNLKSARVFVSVFPESETEYCMKSLSSELYKLQKTLHTQLRMRPVPRIILERDSSESSAQKIEDALAILKQERSSGKSL